MDYYNDGPSLMEFEVAEALLSQMCRLKPKGSYRSICQCKDCRSRGFCSMEFLLDVGHLVPLQMRLQSHFKLELVGQQSLRLELVFTQQRLRE